MPTAPQAEAHRLLAAARSTHRPESSQMPLFQPQEFRRDSLPANQCSCPKLTHCARRVVAGGSENQRHLEPRTSRKSGKGRRLSCIDMHGAGARGGPVCGGGNSGWHTYVVDRKCDVSEFPIACWIHLCSILSIPVPIMTPRREMRRRRGRSRAGGYWADQLYVSSMVASVSTPVERKMFVKRPDSLGDSLFTVRPSTAKNSRVFSSSVTRIMLWR